MYYSSAELGLTDHGSTVTSTAHRENPRASESSTSEVEALLPVYKTTKTKCVELSRQSIQTSRQRS